MKFALVDGQKLKPRPKLKGVCNCCVGEMVAKCGRVKQWHWAHKCKTTCDPWWENETEWHRNWKNEFPEEWQEIVHMDNATGEKHIADVRTEHGLVIEFQHSPIKLEEVQSREAYYQNMIWIVDGSRGQFDAVYFNMYRSGEPIQDDPIAYSINWRGRSRLFHNWAETKCKVFLDFGDNYLWQLIYFDTVNKRGAVGLIIKEQLIKDCLAGNSINLTATIKKELVNASI